MKHFALVSFVALVVTACGGMDTRGPVDPDPSPATFLGSYKTTITLSGTGSQTFTDSLSINEGATSDLILQSQQLGAVKATILGTNSFSIDQQQITLTDANGVAFPVTIQGQGTVNSGVFGSSGTMSATTSVFSFTMNGSKL